MIVTDLTDLVLGSSVLIERVDNGDEADLIKVYTPGIGVGYYYIGTEDRDLYPIYNEPDLLVPDPDLIWYFNGTDFWNPAPGPTQSPTESHV